MELLKAGAKSLGLTLDSERVYAFETYYKELTAWNQRFNLTAVVDYAEVQCRHFLDSLSCLLAFPLQGTPHSISQTVPLRLQSDQICLDVGSGAGFPGIPIKIVLPESRMTLLEATGKKAAFLRHMVSKLNLANTEVVNARAEEAARLPQHRAKYDVVLARAVAPMSTLAEYCLPFCRIGGRVIAQKGSDIEEEIAAAQGALGILGGEIIEVKSVAVPGIGGERSLVLIAKTRETPEKYPRRPGMPAKRPLA